MRLSIRFITRRSRRRLRILLLVCLAALAPGCPGPTDRVEGAGSDSAPPTVARREVTPEIAWDLSSRIAAERRASARDSGFEAFKSGLEKDPGGKYIVNGDTPILNEKHLREFFDRQIAGPDASRAEPRASSLTRGRLVIVRKGGESVLWNAADRANLGYCVSRAFRGRYAAVVAEMRAAADAWEGAANVRFEHRPDHDDTCDAFNPHVTFDVRPVDVKGRYLARAFFPNDPRSARNVLVDDSSFDLDPAGALTLRGILRHELGHALGFRHEHTRPEAGECFEDRDWDVVTDYDAFSVMHYPHCNGQGEWRLTLTAQDRNGAACLYGAAPGFTIDTSICEPTVAPARDRGAGAPTTRTFSDSVGFEERAHFGPFPVVPGSRLDARIAGTGDPDLYVRFDLAPTFSAFHCRPYLVGADERCVLDVPADATDVRVMVRGYTEGRFDLEVTWTGPRVRVGTANPADSDPDRSEGSVAAAVPPEPVRRLR